jgi:hypothetical protein
MESFFRYAGGSGKRVCVLSWPSQLALNSIRKLWFNNHSVFPILPTRSHRLVHLLAESRCEFLLVHPDLPADFSHVKNNLGIPIVTMTDVHSDTHSTNNTILFESRANSSIPVVGETNWSPASPFPRGSSILPFSSNWLFDAQSCDRSVFQDSGSPDTLVVDLSTIDLLISNRDNGLLDTSNVRSVVVDVVSRDSDVTAITMKQLREKLDILAQGSKHFARLMVPEASLAETVPLGNEFECTGKNGVMLVKKDTENFSFIGRPKSMTESSEVKIHTDLVETGDMITVTRRERITKKRIMQADWRIRQVPIAVYHKKRGFKGQIYYTTKHKGWTFYKSRY